MEPRVRLFLVAAALSVTAFSPIAWGAERPSIDVADELARLQALPLRDVEAHARIFIMGLDAGQVALARPLVFAAPASAANDALIGALLERWGQLDGPTAYAYAADLTTMWRTRHETSALAGWAASDPHAAWDRLMAVTNRGADSRYDEGAVLSIVGNTNLPLALEFFEDLSSERSCLMCNAAMLTIIALHGDRLSLVTDAIARMGAGPARNALRDAYWEMLGRYRLPKALLDVTHITNVEDARAARVHLAGGWASRDFVPCFEYVLANYDTETMEQTLLPIIQKWSVGAVPEDVAAVITKLPVNLGERSLLGLVPLLARVDPRAATAWAVSLPVSAVRNTCIQRGMWTWAINDAEAAYTFFQEQSDTETAGILLWNYLLARVGNNTLKLVDLDDVTNRFNQGWRVRLLSEVSLRLADPTINRTGSFDVKAYAAWVEKQKEYSEAQRTEILRPLRVPTVSKAP